MEGMYAETCVKRAGTVKVYLLKALVIALFVLAFVMAWLTGNRLLYFFILLLAFGAYYLWPMFKVEIEYVFVDGQLDFDVIYGGQKRKQKLRIDFEQVEIIAPKNSHVLDSYNELRVMNFSSMRKDADVYAIIAKSEKSGLVKILFEPDEKMKSLMKMKSPSKFVTI